MPSDPNLAAGLRGVQMFGPDRLTLTDDRSELTVALGVPGTWTVSGPVATNHHWGGDRLHVDLVFTETPHRLVLSLDPAGHRFEAAWLSEPLHPVPVAQLRMPRPPGSAP